MAGERKAVLKEVRARWPEFLPTFKPAAFDADAHRTCDALWVAGGPRMMYGLFVEFSSNRAGDFTGELLVFDTRGTNLQLGWLAEFTPEKEGIYRVGPFACGKDRWWQLRDHEEENFQLFRSLDPTYPESLRMQPIAHH